VGLLPVAAVAPPTDHREVPGEAPPSAMVDGDNLRRVLARMLDEDEFLSPYGLRSLSAAHRAEPATTTISGVTYAADYQPAESTTATFGGNSNWRGPVWFPVNVLLVNALREHHRRLGDEFTVAYPSGSGPLRHLGDVADGLARRIVDLFTTAADGRIPAFGDVERFQSDPRWRDGLLFFEYFDGDLGTGLGAGHQTGWTALVIDLICGRSHR
jgi:hypothetical protein